MTPKVELNIYEITSKFKSQHQDQPIILSRAVTEGKSPGINEKNFKEFLLENIQRVDFGFVKKDVERFVEDKAELNLLDLKLIRGTIEGVYL